MTTQTDPFAPFDRARILHHDDDLIVVDKPAGLSIQSPEADGNDLITRLREFLRSEGVKDPYLAVHEHLDRDVSGAVALSRNPGANPAMADASRRKAVRTTWTAMIEASRPRPRGSARVSLAKVKGAIVPARGGQGAFALGLQWTLLQSGAGRHLLSVTAEGAGARHVRAALASAVTSVAGDSTFRSPPAPRLMLHASRLELPHPSGARLSVEAPLPAVFPWWLASPQPGELPDAAALDAMLREAALARYPLARKGVEAFRVFHGEGEGIAGFDLDRLLDCLVVWIGEQFDETARQRVLDAAASLGLRGVYLKVRPRNASRIVDSRRPDIAPAKVVRGADGPEEMVLDEGGGKYLVRPADGLSTGLFLDQRENRRWIAAHGEGRTLLNLFSYTCAFTVAAARGGAVASVSVDASARVLEQGRRNLDLNALAPDRHVLVCDDVLAWLPAARRAGRSFDLIVLDPPSFSTTHHSRFEVAQDYAEVAEQCIGLLPPAGGLLLACTNSRTFRASKLKDSLVEAAARAKRAVQRMTELPPVLDFPVMPGSEPHMKAIAVHIAPIAG